MEMIFFFGDHQFSGDILVFRGTPYKSNYLQGTACSPCLKGEPESGSFWREGHPAWDRMASWRPAKACSHASVNDVEAGKATLEEIDNGWVFRDESTDFSSHLMFNSATRYTSIMIHNVSSSIWGMSTAILGDAGTKLAGPINRFTEMGWNLYSNAWYFGLLWLLRLIRDCWNPRLVFSK